MPLDRTPSTIDIDIDLRQGDFGLSARISLPASGVTALFGASGAGKTTLINAVAGLVRPDRGRIAVAGTVLFDSAAGINLKPEQRRVGYVFQDGRLFPHMSVATNLRYGERRHPPSERIARFDDVVSLLGLEALLHRRPRTLSGGEKQRVAIGRALLAAPRVLLMDEPLAALDAARKQEILPYLEKLRDRFALPVLYVTHDRAEVERLAGQIVLMEGGHVVASGAAAELVGRLPAI